MLHLLNAEQIYQKLSNQKGNDTCETHGVKSGKTHFGKCHPCIQGCGGNEKIWYHEKHTNTIIAAPEEKFIEYFGHYTSNICAGEWNLYVNYGVRLQISQQSRATHLYHYFEYLLFFPACTSFFKLSLYVKRLGCLNLVLINSYSKVVFSYSYIRSKSNSQLMLTFSYIPASGQTFSPKISFCVIGQTLLQPHTTSDWMRNGKLT